MGTEKDERQAKKVTKQFLNLIKKICCFFDSLGKFILVLMTPCYAVLY